MLHKIWSRWQKYSLGWILGLQGQTPCPYDVAYISNGTVVGLSKMNRIVDYYAKRPQVQERLTRQVVNELQKVLNTKNVACVIDAKHLCVNSRGIRDISSSTVTGEFGGIFQEESRKNEFLKYIQLETEF